MFIKVVSWNTGVQQLADSVVYPMHYYYKFKLSPETISVVLALLCNLY